MFKGFKSFLLIIFFSFLGFYISNAQIFNRRSSGKSDSTKCPIIRIKPQTIYIEKDTSKFVTKEVKVLNYGDAPLKIIRASASCYCSSVKIMNNIIYPMEVGTLVLDINKEGLGSGADTVIFTIVSNAKSSPTFFKVVFIDKKERKNNPLIKLKIHK